MTKSASTSGPDLFNLLADEFAERYRRGERPPLSEYTDKYPELADQIRELFPALVAIEQFGTGAEEATGPVAARPERTRPVPERLGDYRIVREIARGGMGIVYEAVQESLGRHVALKVLPQHRLSDPNQLERFRREARAAALLHHTNIVPVFGVGECDGVHHYAMQYIRGQSLDDVLREVKRLRGVKPGEPAPLNVPGDDPGMAASVAIELVSGRFAGQRGEAVETDSVTKLQAPAPGNDQPPTAGGEEPGALSSASSIVGQSGSLYYRSVARIGVQAAEAIAYAHQHKVLHRDIKPSNLLLDLQGTVWVTDFGLAKAEGTDVLTQTGEIVGTLRYMAPERFRGEADARSDVYALGLTLYEMLALEPAFAAEERARLIDKVLHAEPPKPRQLDPRLPRDLETIVLKAMDKDPKGRYPSAGALADDLRRFMAGEPIRARRSSSVERAWKWCRRYPLVAGLAAAVFVLMLSAVTILWTSNKRISGKQGELDRANQELKGVNAALEANLYSAHIALAERELAANHGARTLDLLDQCPKDLRGWEWHFLKRGLHEEPRVFTLEPFGFIGVAFSPDGQVVAAGGVDGKVRLLDAATGELRRDDLVGEPKGIPFHGVAFSADGQLLAAANCKGNVIVWGPASGQKRMLTGHFGHAYDVAFSPDNRHVAACGDNKVIVWDLRTDQKTDYPGHDLDVNRVVYSPDGARLATASSDQTVGIWDVRTGRRLLTLEGHQDDVADVAFSPDGKHVASASADRTARVWDATTGAGVGHVSGGTGSIDAVTFTRDGRRLVCGGQDGMLRLWEYRTGQEVLTLRGHKGRLKRMAFSPDGWRLATTARGNLDGTVRIWNATPVSTPDPAPLHAFAGSPRAVSSLAFSPDGSLLAFADRDPHSVRVRNVTTGETTHILRGDGISGINGVAFSPEGNRLAAVGDNGMVDVWDIQSRREAWGKALRASDHSLAGVAYRPDGRYLAAGDIGGARVVILDAETGKQLDLLDAEAHYIMGVAYRPVGRYLAAASQDRNVRFWDTSSHRVQILPGHEGMVTSVAFGPDGQYLASSGEDGLVILWDVNEPKKAKAQGRIPAHRDVVYSVAFSPVGRRLATAIADRTVKLWDSTSGRLLSLLEARQGAVFAVAFHPGGQLLASAGTDGTVKIWKLPAPSKLPDDGAGTTDLSR
jgi:WD40 repeat protein/serine/threonine protein kinase